MKPAISVARAWATPRIVRSSSDSLRTWSSHERLGVRVQQQVRVEVDQSRQQRRLVAELDDPRAFGRGAAVVGDDLLDAAALHAHELVAHDLPAVEHPRGAEPRLGRLRTGLRALGERGRRKSEKDGRATAGFRLICHRSPMWSG